MLVNWLVSRLCIREKNEEQIQFLYDTFCFEIVEAGGLKPIFGLKLFVANMKALFPNIQKIRKYENNSKHTFYRGIALQRLQPLTYLTSTNIQTTKLIANHIPSMFSVKKASEVEVVCEAKSGCSSNGNNVTKVLTFNNEGNWSLGIAGENVNIESIKVGGTYSLNKDSIINTCLIVAKINLCNGVVVSTSVIVSRYHTLETWQCKGSDCSVRSIRSLTCKKVIPFGFKIFNCIICQRMKFTYSNSSKETCDRSAMGKDENVHKIRQLLKHANIELVDLFLEQSKNISRIPSGRRWSKTFIVACLQLYNRSPHSYEILTSSNILVLPSPSTLIMYKNKLKQIPGSDESVFEPMEAQSPCTSDTVPGTSDTVLCKECNRDHDNDEWILCDTCNSWFHRICAGLKQHARWKQFSKEDVIWECSCCTHSSQDPKKRKVSDQ